MNSAGWLNVTCLLRMDPLFKSLPLEKKDSLQQNGKENVHPETKRREAAAYRAAHKEEKAESNAEYRATHKEEKTEYRATHKPEAAEYRATHKEEAAESRAAHKEEAAESRAAHKEEAAESRAAHKKEKAESVWFYRVQPLKFCDRTTRILPGNMQRASSHSISRSQRWSRSRSLYLARLLCSLLQAAHHSGLSA